MNAAATCLLKFVEIKNDFKVTERFNFIHFISTRTWYYYKFTRLLSVIWSLFILFQFYDFTILVSYNLIERKISLHEVNAKIIKRPKTDYNNEKNIACSTL